MQYFGGMSALGEHVARYVPPTIGGVGLGGMLFMEGKALVESFTHIDQTLSRLYGDTACVFGLLLIVGVATPIIFRRQDPQGISNEPSVIQT